MGASFQLRTATLEDLPALMPLFAQLDPAAAPLSPERAREEWERLHLHPGFSVRVAQDEQGFLGTYSLLILGNLVHGGAGTAIVENVVVDEDSRGQGIGLAMMRDASERAREAGCYKIALTSGLSRTSAHRFYEGLGFQRHGHSYLISLETSDA